MARPCGAAATGDGQQEKKPGGLVHRMRHQQRSVQLAVDAERLVRDMRDMGYPKEMANVDDISCALISHNGSYAEALDAITEGYTPVPGFKADTPRGGGDGFVACVREGASNDAEAAAPAALGPQYWRHLSRLVPDETDQHTADWKQAAAAMAAGEAGLEYWYKDGTEFDDEVTFKPPVGLPAAAGGSSLPAAGAAPSATSVGGRVSGREVWAEFKDAQLGLFTHSAVDDYTFKINPTSGYIKGSDEVRRRLHHRRRRCQRLCDSSRRVASSPRLFFSSVCSLF